MKNLKVLFAFLMIATFAFTSCEKDDDEDQQTFNKELIGTWKCTEDDGFWFEYTFNEDLTGRYNDTDNEPDEFTFTSTKSIITITSKEGKMIDVKYSLSGNELHFGEATLIKQETKTEKN